MDERDVMKGGLQMKKRKRDRKKSKKKKKKKGRRERNHRVPRLPCSLLPCFLRSFVASVSLTRSLCVSAAECGGVSVPLTHRDPSCSLFLSFSLSLSLPLSLSLSMPCAPTTSVFCRQQPGEQVHFATLSLSLPLSVSHAMNIRTREIIKKGKNNTPRPTPTQPQTKQNFSQPTCLSVCQSVNPTSAASHCAVLFCCLTRQTAPF